VSQLNGSPIRRSRAPRNIALRKQNNLNKKENSDKSNHSRRPFSAPVPPPAIAKKPKPPKPEPKPKVKKPDNDATINITKDLKDLETYLGDTLELSIETSSASATYASQWLFNGELLVEEDGLEVISEPPVYKLRMSDVMLDDEGEYVVELRDVKSDQLATSTCMVYVNEQSEEVPEIVAPLEAIDALVGEAAEFRALAYSSQSPQVSWFFNTERIEASEKYEIGNDGEEYFLIVNDCDSEDAGEYMMEVKNSVGVSSSVAALEIVQDETKPPVVYKLPECEGTLELTEGDELRLEFDVESESPIDVTWSKNKKQMKEGENLEMFSDDKGAYLLILNATASDSGNYVAAIKNLVGKEELSFEVKITGNQLYSLFSHYLLCLFFVFN